MREWNLAENIWKHDLWQYMANVVNRGWEFWKWKAFFIFHLPYQKFLKYVHRILEKPEDMMVMVI